MNKTLSALAILALTTFATISTSQAATIDFDSIGTTGHQTATYIEDGYNLELNQMYIGGGSTSTASQEVERSFNTSGFLEISQVSGGTFQFDSIDWETESGVLATISIEGFLSGSSVGVDVFTSTIANTYQTFFSSILSGIALDSLRIYAARSSQNGFGAFDTLNVSSVSAVPVPAALFLFAPALLGFFGLRRKAKTIA